MDADALREQMKQEEERSSIAEETDDVVFFSNWNTAQIIQVHKWNRGDEAFTARLTRKNIADRINFWGPYLSEYGSMTPDGRYLPPLVLIGTGAGCGPLLDFYLYFTTNEIPLYNPVVVYFSTNSIGLFQFFTDLTCSKSIDNWTVNAHLTSHNDYEMDFEDDIQDDAARGTHSSERDMKVGRLSFMEVLSGAPSNSEVYFCGAPALQWKVEVACKTNNLTYHPGHRFSSEGGVSCRRVGPCKFACR